MPLEERYRTVWLNKNDWETAKIYSIKEKIPITLLIHNALHNYVVCTELKHEETIEKLTDQADRMKYILKQYIDEFGELNI